MDQKNLLPQALGFIQTQRKYRWWQRGVIGMAAAVVFVTTYLLILPAITMENSIIEVTATPSDAVLGEVIHSEIFALADDGWEETYFVLTADGDNAGLDESQIDFGSENTALIEDDNGQSIQLHREYTDNGQVQYWFVLSRGQSASFSLPWINGVDRYRTEEIAEEAPVQPEESDTIPSTEELPGEETSPTDTDTDEIIPPETDPMPEESTEETSPIESEEPTTDAPPQDGSDMVDPLPEETPVESETETPAESETETPAESEEETSAESETEPVEPQETEMPSEENTPPQTEDTDSEDDAGSQEEQSGTDSLEADGGVIYAADGISNVRYVGASSKRATGNSSVFLSMHEAPMVTASYVTATDSNADHPSEEEDESESSDGEKPNLSTPESESSVENQLEDATDYYTDTILDQWGDPEQEGTLTISFGYGHSLEAAANADDQSITFSWRSELEYFCGMEEHFHDPETCYDVDGQLICMLEEHQHMEECLHPQSAVVYQYEDDFISVTATPEYEDAIPADAHFQVTQVTADTDGYQYDAYMQALGEVRDIKEQTAIGQQDILLYDIAFLVEQPSETEETGSQIVEFQPTEGSVHIQFTFKQLQIQNLSEKAIQDYQVLHLPLVPEIREQVTTTAEAVDITAGDVLVEDVEASVSGDLLEFSLTSFSLVAFVPQDDGSVIPVTEVAPGLDYTYRDVLGSAINYGITAEEIHKVAHMDTTFAASHVDSDGGNITTGAYTGSQGSPLLIGSITGGLSIDGQASIIYTTEEAARNITLQGGCEFRYCTQEEITSQVEAMIAEAALASQIMAEQRTYSVMKFGWYWNGTENVEGWYVDQNEREIDLSALPDGTYYIDGDTFLDKNDIKIKKNSGQTVVFNLKNEAVVLKRFEVTNVDTGKSMSSATSNGDVYPFASTVIFNMPNAKTVNIESGIFGVLIAPEAAVSIGSTSSGWIVADTVTNPGGEWHFIYQELTKPLSVTVTAKKSLDGEAPDENVAFSFRVERWEETTQSWIETQVVHNFCGDILFRETFEKAGEYYYRISELNEGGGYQYDGTQYIIKIEVISIQGNILQAEQTVYKTGEKEQVGDETRTDQILFQNTTGTPGYVLPETGGAGTTLFTTGGLALMALAGLMYKILRRKGKGYS